MRSCSTCVREPAGLGRRLRRAASTRRGRLRCARAGRRRSPSPGLSRRRSLRRRAVLAELDVDRHGADGDHRDAGERLLRTRHGSRSSQSTSPSSSARGRPPCRARMDASSFFRGQRQLHRRHAIASGAVAATLMDGKALAARCGEGPREVEELGSLGLATVLVGNDPASEVYILSSTPTPRVGSGRSTGSASGGRRPQRKACEALVKRLNRGRRRRRHHRPDAAAEATSTSSSACWRTWSDEGRRRADAAQRRAPADRAPAARSGATPPSASCRSSTSTGSPPQGRAHDRRAKHGRGQAVGCSPAHAERDGDHLPLAGRPTGRPAHGRRLLVAAVGRAWVDPRDWMEQAGDGGDRLRSTATRQASSATWTRRADGQPLRRSRAVSGR